MELMQDSAARTVATTHMEIAGHEVLVSTVFAIVEQIEMLYNIKPGRPALWVTEVVGGPPDIDGTHHLACSKREARENHDLMVERMIASGCYLVFD